MSWLFSQALAAACSDHTFSDGKQFAQLNVMPTPRPFWRNDKTTDICRLSRSGLTCAVLTVEIGAALLTSYLAAFPVRTSVSPAPVMALTASDPGSGRNLPGLLARYDRGSHSLKTAQCSLFEDSTASFATLPRSGSMRNGAVCLRPKLAPITSAIVSGFWPTPTTRDDNQVRGISAAASAPKRGTTLGGAVRVDQSGRRGQLNPDWTEWLMGWPIGWTALERLGTDRFQEWRLAHSCSLQQGRD